MGEGGGCPNTQCGLEVKLLIVKLKKDLQFFVCHEVTRVRGDAAKGDNVGPFPEAKDAIFLVQDVRD